MRRGLLTLIEKGARLELGPIDHLNPRLGFVAVLDGRDSCLRVHGKTPGNALNGLEQMLAERGLL